jgi:sugar phosphate isomerase/epimerase
MYYTGFADEAGVSIETQIKATQELGWSNIEARNIDGVNLTDISDEKFDEVAAKLTAAGVKINCFGSAIANWSKAPRNEDDFQYCIEALRRAIPRMQRLGATMLRGMSFAVAKDESPDNPALEKIIFTKVKYLVGMCADAGLFYLHENCMNYGGMSHQHTLKLLEQVNSPYFKLVFDTGNPISTDRRIGPPPYRKQSAWEFYANVKEFVHYVHIKDGRWYDGEPDGAVSKIEYTFPGEGQGDVKDIVKDLLKNGYNGGFSIEPHLAVVFHDNSVSAEDEIRYRNYVEYGRRFIQLVKQAQAEILAG